MNSSLDNFDQESKPPAKKASSSALLNILTLIILIATLCMCALFASLIANPYSLLNPFPPSTHVPPLPTATWTPHVFPATWTPTTTVEPTDTSTPRPTLTLEPSDTPFSMATVTSIFTATVTVPPSRTPRPTGVPYTATVAYYDSTTFRADTSCANMFVAGQTLDSSNNPVTGLIIRLGGSVPGKSFTGQSPTLSGIAPVYGPSGFEFMLGIQPVSSSKTLWIQLYDQSNAPLSDQIYLTTYNDCKKNLIYVRFSMK